MNLPQSALFEFFVISEKAFGQHSFKHNVIVIVKPRRCQMLRVIIGLEDLIFWQP